MISGLKEENVLFDFLFGLPCLLQYVCHYLLVIKVNRDSELLATFGK